MTLTFKRGDTFRALCQRVGVDITDTIIRSQIRKEAFVADLTVTVTDAANGEFSLTATASQTSTWLTGKAYFDIEYTDGIEIHSTETAQITIVEDMTR